MITITEQLSLENKFSISYLSLSLKKMAKGKFKRRASGHLFQKSKASSRWTLHHDKPGTSATLAESDVPTRLAFLRSQGEILEQKTPADQHLGNRIVDLGQIIAAMNSVYRNHQIYPGECNTIDLCLVSEWKVGLGSELQFRCNNCKFVSRKYKTYKPPAGSSRGAAINMLLASGLQDTAIGVHRGNLLLTAMDIPPPSKSHLQTLMDKMSARTEILNNEDMAIKRQIVINENTARGAQDPHQIDISFDCRYNANRMISSYKPGQSASQAYGVAVENHTNFKYIVGLAIENKLCWTGAYLRNNGYPDVKCPGGHEGCTANTDYMTPHSERRMAHDLASDLNKDKLVVRTLTTDGDTKSFLGVQDFYDKLDIAWNVTRQADPNHLGSTQIRRARQAKWSAGMFCTSGTRARQQAVAAFARDLKSRCSQVIDHLRALGDGDLKNSISKLPEVCAATVECYAGNCSFCPHHSLVCSGIGGTGHWWYDSQFLPTHGITTLKMTEEDKDLLRSILQIRLSEQAIYSVCSNTSTQKCEAFNRGVLSVLPKEVNYPKNFRGKLASKTLELNNSIQDAVERKVTSITGRTLSLPASRYLRQTSRVNEKRKRAQKTTAFKRKRRQTRSRLEFKYHNARSEQIEQPEYIKGQMDIPT